MNHAADTTQDVGVDAASTLLQHAPLALTKPAEVIGIRRNRSPRFSFSFGVVRVNATQEVALPLRYLLARFQCVCNALQHLFEARTKLASTEAREDAELSLRIDKIAGDLQERRATLLRDMDDFAKTTKLMPDERARIALAGLSMAERLRFCAARIGEWCPSAEGNDVAKALGALADAADQAECLRKTEMGGGKHV